MNQSAKFNAEVAQIELSISIAASLEQTWHILTTEIDTWWHPDYYATSTESKIILELVVGGRLYEDSGKGSGLLWYTVIAIDPPHTMTMSGNLAPPFGGPAVSMLYLRLETVDENKTTLHIIDSVIGKLGNYDLKEGWRILFEEGFKKYIEQDRQA